MPTTRSSTKQVKLDEFTDERNIIEPNKNVASRAARVNDQPQTSTKATMTTTTTREQNAREQNKRKLDSSHGDADSNNDKASTQVGGAKRTKKQQDVGDSAVGSISTAEMCSQSQTPKSKHVEQQALPKSNIHELEKPIMINRSPVLQLWGAMVTHFLHPNLSWQSCLSIGNGISALCAVTKGQTIGIIKPKEDRDENEDRDVNENQDTRDNDIGRQNALDKTRHVRVLGFPLRLQGGVVFISGKSKGLKEETLKAKFGGDDKYEQVKQSMFDGLESWKGNEDKLDKKAFRMYEKFRPNVSKGQRGWGRKGELNPYEITGTIKH